MVSITVFCALYFGHLVLFLLFLLVLGTQRFLSLVPRLLVSVLVPYYILLPFSYYTHVLVLQLNGSFLFPTSSWFTLPFSLYLIKYGLLHFITEIR